MKFLRTLEAACALMVAGWAAGPLADAASNMSFGIIVGTELPSDTDSIRVGRETYYVYHGSFYQRVKAGYILVPAPLQATIRELPRGAVEFKVGRTTYFRHAGVYFRATGHSYRVCEEPEGAPTITTASTTAAPKHPPLQVRRGGESFVFLDGRFYLQSPDGLLGRSIPLGAIAGEFPREAMSVWFRNNEYFECNGVFFQDTGSGFKIVPPPWRSSTAVPNEALAQASNN